MCAVAKKKHYLGNFNVWMDQQNCVVANEFRSELNNFGLENHVNKATHNLGNTLDIIIECVENSIVGSVYVELQNTVSDHMAVILKKNCGYYCKKQNSDKIP